MKTSEKQYQLQIAELQLQNLALQIQVLQMQGQALVAARDKIAAEVKAEVEAQDEPAKE
jgi:hypothetical protein